MSFKRIFDKKEIVDGKLVDKVSYDEDKEYSEAEICSMLME